MEFIIIEQNSEKPSKAYAKALSGIVPGSLGTVKARQFNLFRTLLQGVKKITDASSSTAGSDGLLAMDAETRSEAIDGMGFQRIYNSLRAVTAKAVKKLSDPEQVRIANNQTSQIFGPMLNVAQVLRLGSEDQINELAYSLIHGPDDKKGEPTDPSFSNTASIAKAVREEIFLASSVSYEKAKGETVSMDQLRKEMKTLDKLKAKVKIQSAVVSSIRNPLSKDFN